MAKGNITVTFNLIVNLKTMVEYKMDSILNKMPTCRKIIDTRLYNSLSTKI